MANNKRKNIHRSLMEDLYIGNLTNDTTEEEALTPPTPLGARRYYTPTQEQPGKKVVHRQWGTCWVYTQSDAPTVLELNGMSFKNRNLVIQSGERHNYAPMEVSP